MNSHQRRKRDRRTICKLERENARIINDDPDFIRFSTGVEITMETINRMPPSRQDRVIAAIRIGLERKP